MLISARSVPSVACVSPPENEQVMLETFSINFIKVHRVSFIILVYYDARSTKR
jgi:hypothetical protein